MISNLLSSLALAIACYGIVLILLKPIQDPLEKIKVIGLEHVPEDDILNGLKTLKLNNINFFQLNSKREKIKTQIEKNPLIKSSKIRSILLPESKIEILVNEIDIMAVLNSDQDKILLDNKGEAHHCSHSRYSYVKKVYSDVHITKIFCSFEQLNKKDLQLMYKIMNYIELSLRDIGIEEKIKTIYSKPDGNFKLIGNHFNYKIGKISQESLKRVKRLKIVLAKIRELINKGVQIKYIDLSLATEEIILGKES